MYLGLRWNSSGRKWEQSKVDQFVAALPKFLADMYSHSGLRSMAFAEDTWSFLLTLEQLHCFLCLLCLVFVGFYFSAPVAPLFAAFSMFAFHQQEEASFSAGLLAQGRSFLFNSSRSCHVATLGKHHSRDSLVVRNKSRNHPQYLGGSQPSP